MATDIRDSEPDWGPFLAPAAPAGAPNVLMIVWDDVGYGALEPFGGPIETPAMRRIADSGVRYSNFHTTALCSPTRSSLLNGRNATSNNMACITEASAGFPGFSGRVPFENGMISEVLNARGWNTYAVGKWHLTPSDESDASSWKGRWPLGRGFERFYGFLGGETNQWYPDLVYDNHTVEPPATPEQGYHLSADLADKAIRFVRDAKAVAPPEAVVHVLLSGLRPRSPPRVQGLGRSLPRPVRRRLPGDSGGDPGQPEANGIATQDLELSPINPHGEPDITGPDGRAWPALDFVRPWDSLTDDERRLFVRMAEVYAGFVSYTDEQIGGLLDYLAESGQLDNTIIVVVSDNGASGEGGPNGSFNENKFFNSVPDTIEANLPRIDDLGGPSAYNHYNTGWAWAFDTPFPYWKRFAGYEGGVADPLIVSWPAGIAARGEVRDQYVHAVDIVPTLYELLDVDPPAVLNGWTQSQIEGHSFAASISDPQLPGRATQFYSMLGMRALYHQGWLATTLHPPLSGWSNFDKDRWEPYDLRTDRTQLHDLADEKPELLEELKGLWFYYAGVYKGLPLDDRTALEIMASPRPEPGEPRSHYVYYPDSADVPEAVAVNVRRRSFTIAAAVTIDTPEAEGVLFTQGGVAGGHSLFLKDGRLHYVYNWLGERIQTISAPEPVATGTHVLTAEFRKTADDPDTFSALGTLTLYIDTEAVGDAQIATQPGTFSLTGDGLCVGRDSGSGVADYPAPFPFVGGTIDRVIVDVSGDHYVDHEKQVLAYIARD
ncbi:sulfatase-like hydrolase/transferase [Mycobacterium ulcerans]|uniref:sulfatase-like hydrolase/transferase n=1 Tax=Mycobacterium ulcerans TaxID=1809 RepID=UPI001E3E8BD6|nr:sulfatase-like hydrolase/transferase [Mycobacterium ulcerans]MEB4008312.1 sulfatase-like hydrolase/transferase [Mycobacterium ulcerans]